MAITKKYNTSKKKYSVTFTLPVEAAPQAKEVKVVGDFNDWNWSKGLKLKASKKEYKGQLELPKGKKFEFRYLIDNVLWENDWNADDYVPSPFTGVDNSLVVLPNGILATEKKVTVAPKAKPVTKNVKAAPKAKAKKYDFTIIEGVGPKINELLIKAGYKTFSDLASAKLNDLKEVLVKAGSRYTMHDPTTWPEQSFLASEEKWTELKTLQDKLKGGRKA